MIKGTSPWILGISASPHNGAACLLRGDDIIIAIQEERLSRIKRAGIFGAYPSLAIEHCLEYACIRPDDLSLIVSCVTNRAKAPEQDVNLNPVLRTRGQRVPTVYIPHHYGHALSVFATSGFKESAILVIDGVGSPFEDLTMEEKSACKWPVADGWETISLYAASETSVTPLEKQLVAGFGWLGPQKEGMRTFGSLGGMYAAVAYQLFGNVHDGGKVMGLAPYGKPTIPTSEFFEIVDGQFIFGEGVIQRFQHDDRWPSRQPEYSDLSASVQQALEQGVLSMANRLYELCPSSNLCYAGGVALNSVANEKIIRQSQFGNVYIIPAAEDSGTSIGAAYYGLWTFTGRNTRKRLVHDALGPNYSKAQILNAIENTPAVELLETEGVIAETVDHLCDGKIVGWFEGRSELGPRSLGQRSILCDPRRSNAKEFLNRKVKHRESFRPFAPVVLLDNVKDWFQLEDTPPQSPFMLRVCKFQDGKKAQVPAVVHVDDTGRLQTVTPEANGSLCDLTKAFYEKTSVPIILNTSFNVAGEPIVESPQDALNTLLSTGIDLCVLEKVAVRKRREILFERNEIPWPERLLSQISQMMHTPECPSISEQSCNLKHYLGTFEHEKHGVLTIESSDAGLQARLTKGSLIKSRISSSLTRDRDGIFKVAYGPMEGYKMAFVADRAGEVNVAVLLVESMPSNRQFFFRAGVDHLADRRWSQFLGRYQSADKEIVVGEDLGVLWVSTSRQPRFRLIRTGTAKFYLKGLPGYGIQFGREDPAVSNFTIATLALPNELVTLRRSDDMSEAGSLDMELHSKGVHS